MRFHEKVKPARRAELENALLRGKAFVRLMEEESNLAAARECLQSAVRLMDGEPDGAHCQMCGEKPAPYEVCSGCFFLSHRPEGEARSPQAS